MTEAFPSNSRTAQGTDQPREPLNPVTSAETRGRKRGLGRQFKETFVGGSARDAFGFAIDEVIVPTIRDMFVEAMQSGIDRLFYGESRRPRPGGSPWGGIGGVGPKVSYPTPYNRMSQPSTTKPAERSLSRRARARHSIDELVIPSRQEAEEVIDRMFDLLSKYGVVHVADLYELTGIQSSHVDMKWGWVSLRGAKAVRLRQGGFLLDLPEPEGLG
jgi:hypothetical protein